MTPMTDDQLMHRARRRVGLKIGFAIHLMVYLVVNTGLFLLNLSRGGPAWHLAPLLGWGLGLAIHGLVTLFALRGDLLRERWVAEEAQRLRERG
jgi:2TM domain